MSAILDSSVQVDRKHNDLQNMFAHLGIVVPLEVSIKKPATLVPSKMNTSKRHANFALQVISVMEPFSMLLTVPMVFSSQNRVSQDTIVQMELNLPRNTSVQRERSMTRLRDKVLMNVRIVLLASSVEVKGMTTGQMTAPLVFTALVELITRLLMMVSLE